MKIMPKEELDDAGIKSLKREVFIYPTDTIYGIGCDARDEKLVSFVRSIKRRPETPFSVIAPSKKWIFDNCEIDEKAKKWIEKLPGAYTLILNLKNHNAVAKNVSFGRTLGVRIPAHWFSGIVEKLGFPIVTTSVNLHGEKNMASIEDLNEEIKKEVSLCVYEGEKKGSASTIADLSGESERIIAR